MHIDHLPRCRTVRPSRAVRHKPRLKVDDAPAGPPAFLAEREARVRAKQAEVQAELRRLKVGRFATQEVTDG